MVGKPNEAIGEEYRRKRPLYENCAGRLLPTWWSRSQRGDSLGSADRVTRQIAGLD